MYKNFEEFNEKIRPYYGKGNFTTNSKLCSFIIEREMFDEINEKTGFANGDKFLNEQEIREYFTIDNMVVMFGGCLETQEELNAMAETVIKNKWHMREPIFLISHLK